MQNYSWTRLSTVNHRRSFPIFFRGGAAVQRLLSHRSSSSVRLWNFFRDSSGADICLHSSILKRLSKSLSYCPWLMVSVQVARSLVIDIPRMKWISPRSTPISNSLHKEFFLCFEHFNITGYRNDVIDKDDKTDESIISLDCFHINALTCRASPIAIRCQVIVECLIPTSSWLLEAIQALL